MYKTENVRNYDSGKVAKFHDAKINLTKLVYDLNQTYSLMIIKLNHHT